MTTITNAEIAGKLNLPETVFQHSRSAFHTPATANYKTLALFLRTAIII
jgi:hypothetical protein